jgi:viroplasmin and RNaseH domain-containing protein
MEPAQNFESFTTFEEGETSSKRKPDDRKLTKKLKRKIKQQEVLERVIKERYEILSKNFTKTDETLKKLALKRVKEKKQKKKIVKDNNKLWRIAR